MYGRPIRMLCAAVVALSIGCSASEDEGSAGAQISAGGMGSAGASGAGASGAAGISASDAPTFTRVWNEVLYAKGCAGEFCHGSGTGALSMDDQHDAYVNLVGVAALGPACMAGAQLRVSPGQPDASLLLDKLSHTSPSCGDMMPIGARLDPECLDPSPAVCTTAAELDLVRTWIAAGALEN